MTAASDTITNATAVAIEAQRESTAQGRQDVRNLPPNLNHWYALARSSAVGDTPLAVEIWGMAIALYRDDQNQVHALEDRCPHRQVKLSHGAVVGQNLECAYHAWQFDAQGNCAEVPYLEANQKLPSCKIRSYPVREQDGFIWVWPGDRALLDAPVEIPENAQANAKAPVPLAIPEWDHLNYIATVSTIDCEAHFSFLIENLMDMYHGHLHRGFQAWASASLETLEETPDKVDALYTAESYYKIDKIWSISQLFFPALRQLHPEPLRVTYAYPNWTSSLGDDFRIICLFVPISPTHTRAHLIHFVSLNAFWRLHKLPLRFRRFIKDSLFGAAQKMLDGLVGEDVVMLEEEQAAYLGQPDRRPYELNRACLAVQRLIANQATQTAP
ncbi:MAG: aromatic ring-hydroxylating dioxygenase subunit alpha [Synechococcales cyanobacterium RM1_1_8]|nr:aromatic ring-hydroxylating dioxygenase subunit alpha [Synechococcales cyanobacterium RM1_1_8]